MYIRGSARHARFNPDRYHALVRRVGHECTRSRGFDSRSFVAFVANSAANGVAPNFYSFATRPNRHRDNCPTMNVKYPRGPARRVWRATLCFTFRRASRTSCRE